MCRGDTRPTKLTMTVLEPNLDRADHARSTSHHHRAEVLDLFRVETFVALQDVPLSEALTEIRSIPVEWDEGSFAELALMRDDVGQSRQSSLARSLINR